MVGDRIKLREANERDAEVLFRWRNHASTRSMSFSSKEVDWVSHIDWLTGVLSDPSETVLIGQSGDIPIGVVRLSAGVDGVVVSITVSPGHRNMGYGRMLLQQGLAAIRASHPQAVFLADVKIENSSSLKIFEACHFVEVSRDDDAVSLVCCA